MRITEKQLREIINESLLNILRRREQSPQKNGAYRVVGYCNTKDSGRRDYSTVVASLSRHIIYARDEREALRILSKQLRDEERFWYVCDLPDYLPINSVMVGDNDGNFHVLSVEKVGDELKEGKLGRALGTMALGGALMMGNPQDANAQLNVRTSAKTEPEREQSSTLNLRNNLDLYRLVDYSTPRRTYRFYYLSDKESCGYSFAESDDSAFETLNDLLSLIDKKTGTVYTDDIFGCEYSIEYVNSKTSKGTLLIKAIWAHEPDWYMYLTREDIEKAINFVKKYLKH